MMNDGPYIIETARTPNPRRVRIFLAEKNIEVRFVQQDLMSGTLRDETFTQLNPWQRVPVLVLEDGTVISETMAICRYFEAIHPEPSLFGTGAKAEGEIEMWQRRIELGLFAVITHAFRHLNPKMAHLETPQIEAWGKVNVAKVTQELERIDRSLAGRPFIAGDAFSVADITGLVALDFMKPAKLDVPEQFENVRRWHRSLAARPSSAA